jgi:very-long-chain enoyl-CoA reductase
MSLTPRQHNVLSYVGALICMPVVAFATDHAAGRELVLVLWGLHFARRAVEALVVHRYSKTAFPWTDAVIEYVYYWAFASWIGASLPALGLTPLHGIGVCLFCIGELGNARAHWILRQLRTESRGKWIPRGFFFELVSCPHYSFEITTWVGFALVAQSLASAAFCLVGGGILGFWAHTRHLAYRKEFDGRDGRELYPAKRRALIPGVF